VGYVVRFPMWKSIRRRASTESPTRTSSTQRHTPRHDDQDDDTRLYLGPSRSAELLEVVTIVRYDGSELAIHAIRMRAKYRRLLPEG
jgi:hypothetical protein